MLYVFFIIVGLITGAAVGRDGDALWGVLIGFLLAHAVKLGRRVSALEREFERAAIQEVDLLGDAPDPKPTTQPAPPAVKAEPLLTQAEAQPVTASARQGSVDQPVADEPVMAASASPDPQREATEWRELARDTEPASPLPPEPRQPSKPAEPGLLAKGFSAVFRFFTTGNPLVRVGALVLFVGVAFLLRYLAERVSVPVEWRLAGIAGGGVAMVLFGLWVRRKRPGFALPFQGAGIGVLYLTTFASLRLYPVLEASTALVLMLIIVGLTVTLALRQNAAVLAAFGVVGGFLAPVLASTGQGSHVELFSFYLILNIAIGAIAWFRAWRWLNWLGFVFTFGIASVWGERFYSPEFFASTEPFLLAHVALYLAVSILFASRQPPQLKGWVDATLVFGTPLVGFGLQALLLEGDNDALAISSAVFGLVYIGLRQLLLWRDRDHFALLAQCFLALGVGFLTLSIPLAFDARVTSAMWTLEGAAVAWVGIRQAAPIRRWVGYALMLVGSLAYLGGPSPVAEPPAFVNAEFIGIFIIAATFGFIADRLRLAQLEPRLPGLATVFLGYAGAWWLVGGMAELDLHFAGTGLMGALLAFFAVTLVPGAEFARIRQWPSARALVIVSALVFALFAMLWRAPDAGPLLRNAHTGVALGAMALLVACGARLRVGGTGRQAWADVLGAAGMLVWLVSGYEEIDARFTGSVALHAALLFSTASLGAASFLAGTLAWPAWKRCLEVLLVVGALLLVMAVDRGLSPVADWGLLAWPLFLASAYGLVHRRQATTDQSLALLHAASFWTATAWLTYTTYFVLGRHTEMGGAWVEAALAVVPLLLLSLVRARALDRTWPVAAWPDSYRGWGAWPGMLWLAGWLIVSNLHAPGSLHPFPDWPVLNIQDLTCLAATVLLARWWAGMSDGVDAGANRLAGAAIGGLGFLALNAALLRALHRILPIAWDFELMLDSFTVQASITLLWVATALGLMVAGARTARRWVWMTGAALMGVVVLKLFVVDTAASGTLARIAAFFGVAIGLFVAGYFVPRPPQSEQQDPSAPG